MTSKKSWFLLSILFVLSGFSAQAQSWRFGGDDVGNGGGLAEKNILMAVSNMEFYANLCLDTDGCRLTKDEKQILRAIVKSMPRARRNKKLIVFRSERHDPGSFTIDGEVKVARTGSKVGSPIYINTDLLYARNNLKRYEAVSLAQAVAIMIHELGHHVSSASHAELDLLGIKVSMMLQNQIQATPVLPWSRQIEATIVQGSRVESFPQVLLTVGDQIWDLSKMFRQSVFCPVFTVPVPVLPFPDMQFGKKKPLGAVFHNVHWEKAEKEDVDGDFVILGNLTHVCPTGSGKLSLVNSFRVRIEFSTREDDGVPQLDPDSVDIEQSYEPWYKIILFKF